MKLCKGPAKLKAVLISNDAGKTWMVSRQFYCASLDNEDFMDISYVGVSLKQSEESQETKKERATE